MASPRPVDSPQFWKQWEFSGSRAAWVCPEFSLLSISLLSQLALYSWWKSNRKMCLSEHRLWLAVPAPKCTLALASVGARTGRRCFLLLWRACDLGCPPSWIGGNCKFEFHLFDFFNKIAIFLLFLLRFTSLKGRVRERLELLELGQAEARRLSHAGAESQGASRPLLLSQAH